MRKFVSLIACAVLLAGCGGTASSSVAGNTYSFTSCTEDGKDVSDLYRAMFDDLSFTFNADGTAVESVTWTADYAAAIGVTDPVEIEGTYTESGSTVTVLFEDEEEGDLTMEFTAEGDTLTSEEDGVVTVYTLKEAE